jgi:hypothetical protein
MAKPPFHLAVSGFTVSFGGALAAVLRLRIMLRTLSKFASL